jgi:glycosyltransferase involved in cell wall biosynthesis
MKKLPVTVIVPIKNEEKNLANCLSLLGSFEDIWVVDSGSTDSSCSIAKKYGASVLQFEWQGGFPKKRNWVLMNHSFSTDWVLFLDADEAVTPEFVEELATAIQSPDKVGFWLNYTNYFMGRDLKHGVPQRKLALFRKDAGFYERIEDPGWSQLDMEIHEHPILTGAVGEIHQKIDHRDFRGVEQFISRHNSYSSWEANRYGLLLRAGAAGWAALTKRQKFKYRVIRNIGFAPLYFFITYVFKFGFLDGVAGFDYALFKMAYFQNIRLKMIEIESGQ